MLSEWKPIDTAPKDGTYILAWDGAYYCVVEYVDWKPGWWNGDVAVDLDYYTHWTPLPEPPK